MGTLPLADTRLITQQVVVHSVGAQFLQGVVSAPFEPSMRVQEHRVPLSLPLGHTEATTFLGTEDHLVLVIL